MAEVQVVVCGAGGFIGGHLVRHLVERGSCAVRAVDLKPLEEWHQVHPAADNRRLDLRSKESCWEAVRGADEAYNLACDMGGIGFIEKNKTLCMLSVLINTHLLMAAAESGVRRYFFASSACVYNAEKQSTPDVRPLKVYALSFAIRPWRVVRDFWQYFRNGVESARYMRFFTEMSHLRRKWDSTARLAPTPRARVEARLPEDWSPSKPRAG